MWFGTRNLMQEIKDPAVNMGASKVGWQTQSNYLNGGAYTRNSVGAHKEYDLSWNLTDRDTVREITDYADGVFGSGLVYWADPFVMDKNMLNMGWSVPSQGASDGVILTGTDTRPTLLDTPGNTLGYPTQSAVYTVGVGDKPYMWIPVPPGYTAWVGVHGTAGSGGYVAATTTTGPNSTGATTVLSTQSVTDTNRFSYSVDSPGIDGLYLTLGGTGTVVLSGLMVQVLPTGYTPPTGGFISGQGHSGCRFASQPVLTQYSAVMDKVGLTAKLIEIGSWL
jgi:hypothetical protein